MGCDTSQAATNGLLLLPVPPRRLAERRGLDALIHRGCVRSMVRVHLVPPETPWSGCRGIQGSIPRGPVICSDSLPVCRFHVNAQGDPGGGCGSRKRLKVRSARPPSLLAGTRHAGARWSRRWSPSAGERLAVVEAPSGRVRRDLRRPWLHSTGTCGLHQWGSKERSPGGEPSGITRPRCRPQ
jgi:hypothetical protein